MRAISIFRLEAGISTFWCRARIALRIRVSMSATGSVNFIVLLLRTHTSGGPNYRTFSIVVHVFSLQQRVLADDQGPTTDDDLLPGRLRHSRNFPAQCQTAETQAA